MQIARALGLVLAVLSIATAVQASDKREIKVPPPEAPNISETQQIVENVDIQGNRRLRDEDLFYYIRTRPGDTYDPAQLERDLQELLSLSFFDKTSAKVLTEPGIRGGVNVIFEVRELPIIRDLQFEGAKALQESDILKAFRENRIGISKEAVYDPAKARDARRLLRELLAAKGYPNAKVDVVEEEVSATSTAITFEIEQGRRSRIVDIDFEGNENFDDGELRKQLQLVRETGLISRFKGQDILDLRKLEYDLNKNVREYMFSKGYFQARIGEPRVEGLGVKRTGFPILKLFPLPLVTSKDDTLRIIVPVQEGRIFRVGEVAITGNSIFSEQQISAIIGVQKGEIANGKRLREALFEDLKKIYGAQGFVEYDVELDPEFRDNPENAEEGIVDLNITIDEGTQFRLRRLEFAGNTFTRDEVLRREMLVNEGDIYNQVRIETSVIRLNQTGYFDPIDKDQDLEVRTYPDEGEVDVAVKVRERGRQQISFNGGTSGLSGTFVGLEYSTNNLLGRGEVLSFAFGLGNRQRNFQFTFQEPYFQDRPIAVGVSVFASSYKFFGEGTFLSQNQNAIAGALNPLGTILTDESTLFTQNTIGANVFATAPLSELFFKKQRFTQFSRIGISYQFSATSIEDPPVNESLDPADRIPIIFEQPNIITSRITPTFVYDTRQPMANGIDTLRGTQISASFALAGLGGDVRTYHPNITFTKFIPVRRKRSENAEVFGFRIQAGTIGSFATTDTIRNANSLSFVGGVPIFERYFLGSEFDVRGYNTRSIGPIAPYDSYVTTRNVVVANNIVGEPVEAPGLSDQRRAEIAALGLLNGPDGEVDALFRRNFRFIGGDTQLLGNFEYRIPIFGPLTLAAFADVGAVFNLRNTGTQRINSEFLRDDTFLGSGTLGQLAVRNYPQLANSFGALLYYQDQLLTQAAFRRIFCPNQACPDSVPPGIQTLFLRGEAQTNSLLEVDNAAFNGIGDYRSSIGIEARVQVPVVNVPFRLIYYYNPNGVFGVTEEAPGLFLPGKRSGFRFTVGRTF
ncbi:MAG: outer membrane protein assembly factor BamA [Acidobacteria bacterium]|nr:MAG: outer membrane protein assembly factor BamA [Acidobacteriota bacterium]REJ98714.1 MAG: outer membrane protein assembly factor BamA [Acidobacteriota bacterium]REK16631.1 MAG: outer membrane protein assembly factor BamA [Acidobacteriota bacterium]REK42542.1 MAG: outer membrane protein assembly factor BamA [Acidobacteriota bacterium]